MSVVDVAVAILIRGDGAVLFAQRPAGKVYAGYWEFPGGKIEPGESARAALDRELEEELGVHLERAYPWIMQTFTYPHATVRLHFFRVVAWRGEPHGREDQAFAWRSPQRMDLAPMLPANTPLLDALSMPFEYGISNALASHHLKKLREAGLVKTRRRGAWLHCRLDERTLLSLADRLRDLALRGGQASSACCGADARKGA